jgi:hypothetical protein
VILFFFIALFLFITRGPTRTLISPCCRTVHCKRDFVSDIAFTYRNINMTGIRVFFTSKPRAPKVHNLFLLLGPSFEGFHYEKKLYENFICIFLFSLYMSLLNVKTLRIKQTIYDKHRYVIVMWVCKLYVEHPRWFIIHKKSKRISQSQHVFMNVFIKRRLFSAPCLGHHLAVIIQESKYIRTFIVYIYSLSCIIVAWIWPKLGSETGRSL